MYDCKYRTRFDQVKRDTTKVTDIKKRELTENKRFTIGERVKIRSYLMKPISPTKFYIVLPSEDKYC